MEKRLAFLQKILVASVLVVSIVLLHMSGMTSYISLTWLQENVQYLQAQVREHYWYVVIMYLASYVAASACAVPGSSFFIIAAGLLFGLVSGIIFATLGIVIGATLLFLTSRYIIGSWVQKNYVDALVRYNRAIERDGYFYMLLARVFAVFPFCLLNIIAGVTLLPIQTFVWTTAVGMLPYVVLYTFVGQQLGGLQPTDTVLSSPMVMFFSTIAFRVSLLPFLLRYVIKSRHDSFWREL